MEYSGLDHKVKHDVTIALIGNCRVGKTALVQRLAQGSFTDEYVSTVGVDYDARILDVDSVFVRLHLWDVAGDENFVCLAREHINKADGFAFVYDIADDNSFQALPRWLLLVSQCAHARNLPKICIGAKVDLRHRQMVSASKAKEFAIPEDMSHIEVSAESGRNVNVAFYMLASEVLRYRKLGTIHRLAMLDYPLEYSDLDVHEDPSGTAQLSDDGPQYTHLFKILLLGAPRTGKTSLRYRFCRNHYSPEYHATSGIEYTTRTVLVDGERVKVQIWDVSGDDVYSHIRKSYYKGANGFIIVYDVTNMQTFVKAEHLLKELSMYGQADTPKLAVGNKCDLTRKRCVDSSTAREWASGWRVPIIETSARSGDNVGAPFLKLTIALKRHLAPWKRVYNFS